MSKFTEVNKVISDTVVSGYKAVENSVVSGYKAVENSVVGGYKVIEKKFVDTFLTPDSNEVRDVNSRKIPIN